MALISSILTKTFRKWGEFGLSTHKDNLDDQDDYILGRNLVLFQI